ncbi:DUF1028 domain-containing protein [Nocardioides sp.]|uniref:DUF1028 domain-containing protein n=1 Tax=Nocardioides sp. TaxID=35761 RepID=UPI003527F222
MTFAVLALEAPGQTPGLTRPLLGLAVASCSLAVGHGVPALDSRVGAIASQAWTNRSLRSLVFAAIADGQPPEVALRAAMADDDGRDYRQVAVLTLDGDTATHTGRQCTPWAGTRRRPGLLTAGNYLTGPEVLEAMVASFDEAGPELPPGRETSFVELDGSHAARAVPAPVARLAARLLRALVAGQAAGGERRGQQSAALMVAGGAGPLRGGPENDSVSDLDIDLRVDDAGAPLAELHRLLGLRLWGTSDIASDAWAALGDRSRRC